MKHLFTLLASLVWMVSLAQPPVPQFPPVPGDDVVKDNYGLWANLGWVLGSDGQLAQDVQFVSEGGFPRIFIRRDAAMSFVLNTLDTTSGGTDTLRRLDMSLVGETSTQPDAIASSAKIQEKHFYLPHCGPQGVTNVPGYNRIVYPSIYPNIDLWVFSGKLGQKFMFVVWPGGDPDEITLDFTGQNQLMVDFNGWLHLQLVDKWISLPEPVAYQFDQNNTILPLPWTVDYQPVGNSGIVHLGVDGYDPSKPLVFLAGPPPGAQGYAEPGLCWSTYMGGDGSEHVIDIETDAAGDIFFTGESSSSYTTFPAQAGLLLAEAGNTVAYLTRFTSDYVPDWNAFIGGDVLAPTSSLAQCVAIREGADQRIFIGGQTTSHDFHTLPNGNAYIDEEYTGTATQGTGFVAEFDAEGQLIWSTYFGDEYTNVNGIAVVPGTNDLVICGAAAEGLPEPQLTPPTGSLDWDYVDNIDAFIAVFNAAGELHWRSWWGGTNQDRAYSVKAAADKIVMSGITYSQINMVNPEGGAYFDGSLGVIDAFIIEFDLSGAVQWSTYVGGSSLENPGFNGLCIGPGGDVFLSGYTESSDLDMVPGPQWNDADYAPGSGFIARFRASNRSPLWLTYFGEGSVYAIIQDPSSNQPIHVAGVGYGQGLPLTPNPLGYNQPDMLEISQGSFFATFTDNQALVHATWFGGAETTNVTAINALASHPAGTLAGGVHSKNVDAFAYFPLDDGQGTAWIDELYNDQGFSVIGSDGFITLFCNELSVGMPSIPSDGAAALTAMHQAGELTLTGADLEGLDFAIHDALGRSILNGSLRRAGERTTVSVPVLASGAYLIRLEDGRAAKFLVR